MDSGQSQGNGGMGMKSDLEEIQSIVLILHNIRDALGMDEKTFSEAYFNIPEFRALVSVLVQNDGKLP